MSDIQAGHEKTLTALLPALTGSSIIYGMGLLEMGICFCYAQLLVDREFVRMIKRVMQGIAVNEDTLAIEVINAVGAGGNYLMQEHTIKYMRQEHSRAKLIDRRTRKGWEELGGSEMIARAKAEALNILADHSPEPLAPAAVGQIRKIVRDAEEKFL